MLSVFKLTCNFIFEQTEWRMMGGEGAHIVETRMFCSVCLKSSCLLICFHSWSLDLSQTLIQTLQILKEDKTAPKPWQNPKKKFHPMSPVQLLLRPSPWVETFCFVCFLFSRSFCHLGPRMPQNPWKNQKKQKSFTPCHLSSFSSDPPMGRFFFGFLEVFATLSVQQCQSLIFLCVFCFPVSWVPGRNFHPDKHPLAQLSLLHILYWCLH